MEHTPGPWKVERTIKGLYYIYHHLRQVAYAMALPDEQETKANANLIAAAPDLLAVAKQAYETLAGWTDILRQYVITEGELEELELALENAIFKAEPDYEP